MQYLVRYSVEFSLLVEADNEDEAIEKADAEPEDEWTRDFSGYEVHDYSDVEKGLV